jgi:hypothetical protein
MPKVVYTPQLTSCEYYVVDLQGKGTVSDILTYYDLIRKYVQHEDNLIHSRLMWSLTVHGFLLAAFAILLGKALDIGRDLYRPEFPISTFWEIVIISIAIFAIAIVGIFICWLSKGAIVASHNSMQHILTIAQGQEAVTAQQPVDRLTIAQGQEAVTAQQPERRGTLLLAPATTPTTHGELLLPKIAGGGASIMHYEPAATRYYLWLPWVMFFIWIVLCAFDVCIYGEVDAYAYSRLSTGIKVPNVAIKSLNSLRVANAQQAVAAALPLLPAGRHIQKTTVIELVKGADPGNLSLSRWHVQFVLIPTKREAPNQVQDTLDVLIDPASGHATPIRH